MRRLNFNYGTGWLLAVAFALSLVALHSLQPGDKTIHRPAASPVTDLVTGERLAKRTEEIRFTMEKPGTRVFRIDPKMKAKGNKP